MWRPCLFALCWVALGGATASAYAAAAAPSASDEDYTVPPGLIIGSGVSALQTEGGWNEGDRGESSVDRLLHTGMLFPGGPQHAHDKAADSFHRFKEDIAMAAQLKFKLYRFSFSWSRLLPTANAAEPNEKGVDYYNQFIDEIIKQGMTPMATLYHFDHPQILEDQFQGWLGSEMVPKFKEYAQFTFNKFASKVKIWTTINEPNVFCTYFIPINGTWGGTANRFKCIRNNILAHAEAYRVFQQDGHKGQVGFSAHVINARPKSTSPEDVYAADAFNEFQSGATLRPVVDGDYPDVVKKLAVEVLIPFTAEEQELIKGTADYIGINVYYGMVAAHKTDPNEDDDSSNPTAPGRLGLELLPFVSLKTDTTGGPANLYSEITPQALRSAMMWTWQTYKLPLFVTENGFADIENLGLHDKVRAAYYSAYMRMLLKTIKEFDVNVIGYCAWSLIDSYEWSANFNRRFGLVHVDYEGGSLNRTLKDSKQFWFDLAETGVVPLVESAARATTASLLVTVMATIACLL